MLTNAVLVSLGGDRVFMWQTSVSAGAEWRRWRERVDHTLTRVGGQRSSDLLKQLAEQTRDHSRRGAYDRGLVAPGRLWVRVNPDDYRQIEETLRALGIGLRDAVRDTLRTTLAQAGRAPVRFHHDFTVTLESSTAVRPGQLELTAENPFAWGRQAFLANPPDRGRPRALGPATVVNQDLVHLVAGRRDPHISSGQHAAVRVDLDGRVTITPSPDPRRQVFLGETLLVSEVRLRPRDAGHPLQVGHTWLDLYWAEGWFVLDGPAGPPPAGGHR